MSSTQTHKIDFKDLPKNASLVPVLAYCRTLLRKGAKSDDKLECYRGDRLDLTVHHIGEGANLTVDQDRTRFTKLHTTIEELRKVGP